ncbi:MAG: HDOD domain-containing protein [Gammaproteobacteria bacterium]|nr:HDOD domain-containing protein [Gammaproteobacteria bacterium]
MQGFNHRLLDTTLPIMPRTGRELRRLMDLASTRIPHFQQVLLSDPAAAVAVFRALEVTRPGSFEQVGDAAHAVSLLGVESFRRLIDALPEVRVGDRCQESAQARAYSEAAHAAYFAASLAQRSGLPRRDELSTAALLQHPAVLALAAFDGESVQRAIYAVRDGVPVDVAFGAELGEPLQQANRRCADAWALPSLARQAIGDWDDLNPRPQLVKLADEISQAAANGWQHAHIATLNTILADFLAIDVDEAAAWLHAQTAAAARHFGDCDYPLPGFELLLLPGDDDSDDDDIPELGAWRRRQAAVARPDLHATMGALMKRIRDEAGTTRVVFAMLSKDRSRLRTRLALGGDTADGIRRLDLGLDERNLFSALMGKPQSLWLNRDNAAKYRDYLPDSLDRAIGPGGAYMMSLFVGDRPLGLMYGDGSDLSEHGYRRFRELCSQSTSTLVAGSRVATPADS